MSPEDLPIIDDLHGLFLSGRPLLDVRAPVEFAEGAFPGAVNLPLIEADATQLRQLVMNLVMNAAEAIGDTGGSVTVRTGVIVLGVQGAVLFRLHLRRELAQDLLVGGDAGALLHELHQPGTNIAAALNPTKAPTNTLTPTATWTPSITRPTPS